MEYRGLWKIVVWREAIPYAISQSSTQSVRDMTDILISIGEKVAQLLVGPIARQFNYVIHRKKYIENLTIQVEMLEALRNRVHRSIDHAKRNRDEIQEDVKYWIKKLMGS
ncbi:hypothetical protein ACSBR1_015221 [Camellia fascicularis]